MSRILISSEAPGVPLSDYLVKDGVMLSFPVYLPIEVANMNFASIAVAAVALISVVTWFTMAKRHYVTPGAVAEYQ